MLKKIIQISLCLSFCFISSLSSISAFNENVTVEKCLNGYRLVNDNGNRYILTDNNEELYLFFDTLGNPVTVDEAFNILTNTGTDDGIQTAALIPNLDPETAGYDSNTLFTGTAKKVGLDVEGPGWAYVDYSISISEGWSASINVTAKIKAIVRAEVEASFSGTYVTSTQTAITSGALYEIEAGKIGAIYFSPYYYKHKLHFADANRNVHVIYYDSPKINPNTGLADGLLSVRKW